MATSYRFKSDQRHQIKKASLTACFFYLGAPSRGISFCIDSLCSNDSSHCSHYSQLLGTLLGQKPGESKCKALVFELLILNLCASNIIDYYIKRARHSFAPPPSAPSFNPDKNMAWLHFRFFDIIQKKNLVHFYCPIHTIRN